MVWVALGMMGNTQPVILSCAVHSPTNFTPLSHLPRYNCHSQTCPPCHRAWSSPCLARCKTPRMNFTPKPFEWGVQMLQRALRKRRALGSPDDEAGPQVPLSLQGTGQVRDDRLGPPEQQVLKPAQEGHWALPKLQATRWAQVGLQAASKHYQGLINWTMAPAMVHRSLTPWCRRGPCVKLLWKRKTLQSENLFFYLLQGGTRDVGACPKSQWIVFAMSNSCKEQKNEEKKDGFWYLNSCVCASVILLCIFFQRPLALPFSLWRTLSYCTDVHDGSIVK